MSFSQDLTPRILVINDTTYFGFNNYQANILKKSLELNLEYQKQLSNYELFLERNKEITLLSAKKDKIVTSTFDIKQDILNRRTEQYENQVKYNRILDENVKKLQRHNKILKIGMGILVVTTIVMTIR